MKSGYRIVEWWFEAFQLGQQCDLCKQAFSDSFVLEQVHKTYRVGDSHHCAQELDVAYLATSLEQQPEALSQDLDLLQTHAAGLCFLSFISLC